MYTFLLSHVTLGYTVLLSHVTLGYTVLLSRDAGVHFSLVTCDTGIRWVHCSRATCSAVNGFFLVTCKTMIGSSFACFFCKVLIVYQMSFVELLPAMWNVLKINSLIFYFYCYVHIMMINVLKYK